MATVYDNAGNGLGRAVDPNQDQGSDSGWASAASARKSRGGAPNQMPTGYEPQAKNSFGASLTDGQNDSESLDCGYRDFDLAPTYGGRYQIVCDAQEEMQDEQGFLLRNNYGERG